MTGAAAGPAVSTPLSPVGDDSVLSRHLRFSLDFHRRLSPHPHATYCWSPFSAASALGLLVSACRGRSREELATVLLGDPAGDLVRYSAMIGEACLLPNPFDPGEPRRPVLEVHNTLWVDSSLRLRTDFTHAGMSVWPGGTVRRISFAASAGDLINREVATQTHGLVPSILPSTAVIDPTVAVLANALYLRATWRYPFPARDTHLASFNAVSGAVETTMMRVRAHLPYSHVHGWQLVDLPAHGPVSITVLLPSAPLVVAERALTVSTLTDLLFDARPQPVRLTLPRLNMGTHTSLTSATRMAGAGQVFSENADLGGLTMDRTKVADIMHETVIRLDEHGLEGATATAATVTRSAALGTCFDVVADCPFLLLVRHRPSNTIYYMARVAHP